MKEYLSVAELCDFLGISKATVHKLSSSKKLPRLKPDGIKNIFFKYSDVVDYMERGRVPSEANIKEETLADLSKCAKN
jgi:excisionase family DNA binding protein